MEKITKNVQLILLIIILISTIIAVGIEIFTMVENKNVNKKIYISDNIKNDLESLIAS